MNPTEKTIRMTPAARYPSGTPTPPMPRAMGATPAITVNGAAAKTTISVIAMLPNEFAFKAVPVSIALPETNDIR